MVTRWIGLLLGSLVLFWLTGVPPDAIAQTPTVTAYVAGQLVYPDSADSATVTLSSSTTDVRTYGCITIRALDATINGGRATIRAADAGPDSIELRNAKIVGSPAGCIAEITAWATFTAPPATNPAAGGNPQTGIRFKRTVAAEAQRNGGSAAASGSQMSATGWVPATPIDEIVGTDIRTFCSQTPPTTCDDFSSSVQEDCLPSGGCNVTGSRDMKIWTKMYFKQNNDFVKFASLAVLTEVITAGATDTPVPPGGKRGKFEDLENDEPCANCCCKECDDDGKGDDRHPCKHPPCKK